MEYRLAANDILAAWEAGMARRPLDRAIAILWAANAPENGDAADLPIAERDRLLLSIRARTFGSALPARATCPDCGAELEMDLDIDRLIEAIPSPNRPDAILRPLTSRDLAAVSGLPADQLAPALRVRLTGRELGGAEAEELDRRIEQAAEDIELRTRLTCSECGADWVETLDIVAHVWTDFETAAMTLLGNVAELASAFGWSEQAILSLSPARRMAYLNQVRQL